MKISHPVLILFLFLVILSCQTSQKKEKPEPSETSKSVVLTEKTKDYNEFRNPYFGETHLHTGWSFDEAIYNVKLGPENTYRHARGEKVLHPNGDTVQLKLPLDFMIVSDHSEYLGVLVKMYDKNDPLSKHPMAKAVVGSGNNLDASAKAFYDLVSQTIQPDGSTKPDSILNSPELKRTIWDEYIKITDKYNDPGKFTTLVGYEWSSQPNMSNQHRNVIFRSSNDLPVPGRPTISMCPLFCAIFLMEFSTVFRCNKI